MVWGAPSPIDENHHDDGDGDHWIHRSLDIEPAGKIILKNCRIVVSTT